MREAVPPFTFTHSVRVSGPDLESGRDLIGFEQLPTWRGSQQHLGAPDISQRGQP